MSNDKPLILVVDDEPDIRELIKDILEDENYEVRIAADGQEAQQIFNEQQPDLILLDIWMPDIDGISLLKEFKQQNRNVTIVMMSGHGTIETAVEATRLGASDFIEKPLSTAKLLRGVEQALENKAKQANIQRELAQVPVGKSHQIKLLREQVERVAKHEMPILLVGEPGVGKHCFSHYLHSLGQFSGGKFIELSPESFPLDSLKITSLAKNNCLYIHDLALLSDEAQALLLHLLETHKLQQCQLICATQYSLQKAVDNGDFLESLLYQLNSITLVVPPLRDHIEDIPELVHHFVDVQTTRSGLPYRRFTVAAQNRLRNHDWSGNILELKNVIQRLLVLGNGEDIDVTNVDLALASEAEAIENGDETINFELPLREAREQFERIYLLRKLQETDGNVGKAAKLAGMERTHLYRKLRSLGIDTKQI
ncbi:sigma-54-dependent transcriptional regulator [Methylophaga sulfidovorans]|uniref:DNA-binding transcriptional response regulator, NtrC family, contains REC, AAA-type ATPase, and a Fis-type DNA-binding domains n=1 Tax=Methylophaga sulfidovorans TaxID=45496 RepID=A0A1I3WAA1_9GAMM|nr:sigma-54 dependent transcriptional regulator [Methylophaga sulfidovorans]SFK03657.1 DNA-binding transcriptional response regulator, NtrC family, contains REC, AAA-type ATPase, and a Fis-type DNA-binding domains [Methylophaga sulfidovorans]